MKDLQLSQIKLVLFVGRMVFSIGVYLIGAEFKDLYANHLEEINSLVNKLSKAYKEEYLKEKRK